VAGPKLDVMLTPARPFVGGTLDVAITITTDEEIVANGLEVSLEGMEQTVVVSNRASLGWGPPRKERRSASHAGLHVTIPVTNLPAGQHRFSARFDLPVQSPPSYAGESTVSWVLSVKLVRPRKLDVFEQYKLVVTPPPRPRPPSQSYVVRSQDQPTKELVIEIALDRTHASAGDFLPGTVTLRNVDSTRIKRVRLELVETEDKPYRTKVPIVVMESEAGRRVLKRHGLLLQEGKPAEGVPLPFLLRIPAEASPSFIASTFAHKWTVLTIVEVSWGSDRLFGIPIQIENLVDPLLDEHGLPLPLPPVGRERRAQAWAAVASHFHLQNEVDREQMTGRIGEVDVAVWLEQRETGIWMRAVLGWPTLGLDLRVEARKLGISDALHLGEIALPHLGPEIAARFTVRGREEEQVRHFFADFETMALASFEEARLDDVGAILVKRRTANDSDELAAFVDAALGAARMFDRSMRERVIPPSRMREHESAWRSFAETTGGRLERGRMWIHAFDRAGERCEIGTRWSDGKPFDTVVRMPLARPLGAPLDPRDPTLPNALRTHIEDLESRATTFRIGPLDLEATLPAPYPDPRTTLPLIDRLAEIVRVLRTGDDRGPYR